MSAFIATLQERKGELLTALIEHMQLSFISLFIAVIIAIPLAIYLTRHKKLAAVMIQITSIFQTIPSLALLGLMIPLVGIGSVPAVIALVIYALLPILRNAYTGLNEIDPSLNEAADAMGMSRWRKLIKVQIPIAMPIIMAGIRNAMVLIIGTGTIAALIGAGGLGSLILLGIDRGNNHLILLGAIPAALLAILFDYLLSLFEKISFKKTVITLGILSVLILGLLIAPLLTKDKEELIIAGKLGAEPEIIMNMYKYLIEDQTDVEVTLEPNMGKTTFVFNALESGDIDVYTEYTGTILATFLNEEITSSDEQEVFQQAKEGLAEQYDMSLLEPMAFNNTYTLAVTKELAEEYQLETISDLIPIADEIKAGFTLEFSDRQDGYLGIQDLYGLTFGEVQTMEPKLRYTAIETGDINLVDAYSTDSELAQYDLVVLEDDRGLFPPYQGAPLMLNETIEDFPEVENSLNQLSGKITDAEMREMNFAVNVTGKSASEVAQQFLTENGLLAE
ncbi:MULTISPECIES: ABC transporter permease/substrate-binding protein [Carnobacterium]|uniref:ABC transporter permease n=2 Tax=Carnobacterium TaxID=2747 RepID=U5SA73_9LACT|nr:MULTISPECIES: ABC transporter permease/substrate-binding protein [Carnobacterium]AGY80983.1 ABC transporter permease [Carnobacterium inhibens subsp. gilichinskyi]MCM3513507.1 ABC transporter permease/substrate-binding protein [Carnobacterium inhibens]UDE96154.1 ABC transporter permease/substrate-binding protein [Carnobacterium viridans]SDQ40259.1 osmoprotectant transport system permease protein [Carnobacterium viridans]